MEVLFGKTINMLSAMLDFRSNRHKLIASNVANLDTPGYRPKDINFKKELGLALGSGSKLTVRKTDTRHLSLNSMNSNGIDSGVVSCGEKVNIDKEMAKLAENHLMYNLTVELLARKFRGIKNTLREGK